MLKACSLCPKFTAFSLEKNEINKEFVEVLQEVVNDNDKRLVELSLSSSKNFSKVVSQVCDTIKDNYYLASLDLSNNNLDAISCKHLAYLIRTSENI